MKPNKKHFWQVIFQIIVILAIGSGSIWIASLFSKEKNNTEEIATKIVEKIVIKKPQCPSTFNDYEKTKQENQTITLIKNFNSYGIANNGFAKTKIKTITLKKTGVGSEIACGYLYILANQNNKPLNSWENIYIKPDQFGGHLNNEIAIISQAIDDKTKILFNINNILYKKERDDKIQKKADWSSLLNVSDEISIDIALNTINPTGKILETSLTYKCWSPETGNVNNDCKLEIIK